MKLTHLCPPLRATFAVREIASLGIMGEPQEPPLNPSETRDIMPRDAVSRTANVERINGLIRLSTRTDFSRGTVRSKKMLVPSRLG